jgi:hypothetical protein
LLPSRPRFSSLVLYKYAVSYYIMLYHIAYTQRDILHTICRLTLYNAISYCIHAERHITYKMLSHAYMYIYMHIYIHAYIYIYIHIYIYIYIYTSTRQGPSRSRASSRSLDRPTGGAGIRSNAGYDIYIYIYIPSIYIYQAYIYIYQAYMYIYIPSIYDVFMRAYDVRYIYAY